MDRSRRITSDVHLTTTVDRTCLSVSGNQTCGRTVGHSVHAESAAVNMKGDTQRTVRSVRHKTPSQHQTEPMWLQAATFCSPTQTHPQNVLTMTPRRYIKVMEVRLHLFYMWKLSEVINCLKPPHATAV